MPMSRNRSAGLFLTSFLYEGGYLRNALRGGSLSWIACRFAAFGPFVMFLDVLESREHACCYKKTFMQKYWKTKKLQLIEHFFIPHFSDPGMDFQWEASVNNRRTSSEHSSICHHFCAKRFLRSYAGSKLECSSVCPSVCLQDNYFLSRVCEPTTRAPGQCCFGNLILKVPEKKLQKVKLSFTTGLFGTNFGTRFWRTFGATLTKTSPVPITVWAACEWVQSDCSRMWRGSDVTCVGWLAASAGVPLMFLSFVLPALQRNV